MTPLINWDTVPDNEGFEPIPDGKYKCKVDNVEKRESNKGDEMWNVRYEVVEGEYEGRKIFDNITFSEDAMKRAKFILHRLGINVSGETNVEPEDIQDKEVFIRVVIEDYTDPTTEETKARNKVPWDGFESIDGEAEKEEQEQQEKEPEEKPKTKVSTKGKTQPAKPAPKPQSQLKGKKIVDPEEEKLPF